MDTGFHTKQMLCMPIKNASGAIEGVSLLINKLDGSPFNKNDEDMFEVSLLPVLVTNMESCNGFVKTMKR